MLGAPDNSTVLGGVRDAKAPVDTAKAAAAAADAARTPLATDSHVKELIQNAMKCGATILGASDLPRTDKLLQRFCRVVFSDGQTCSEAPATCISLVCFVVHNVQKTKSCWVTKGVDIPIVVSKFMISAEYIEHTNKDVSREGIDSASHEATLGEALERYVNIDSSGGAGTSTWQGEKALLQCTPITAPSSAPASSLSPATAARRAWCRRART